MIRSRAGAVALPLATCLLAACTGAGAATGSSSARGLTLPLGDGKVSSSPRSGYVFSCQTSFNGQGAEGRDPWINADGSWTPAKKVKVQGDVSWPQARYGVSIAGTRRLIKTADLPVGQGTGVFPIAADDPASAYDQNPNSIEPHDTTLSVAAEPAMAAQPSCLPLGPVGVLSDGVFLFDALDALGRDAVPHEVLDRCDGHPAPGGVYHHHSLPSCLLSQATGRSTLVGYALDGFGIYVERDAAGNLPTDASLDACHGRVSAIDWDGRTVTMYHYDATLQYPYVIGCFHGTPAAGPAGPPDAGARPGG